MPASATAKKKQSRKVQPSQLDAACKKFFSNKEILAAIMQACIPEYMECSRDEIVQCISQVKQPGTIPVDDTSASQIIGITNEDKSPNEGVITFDVLFDAITPGTTTTSRLILNVEAQNNFTPGYDFGKRAEYYVSRLISSQKLKVFEHQDYQKICKVYSVWVFINPSKDKRGFINHYRLQENQVHGNVEFPPDGYGDINIVFIGLGDRDSSHELIKALSGYFASRQADDRLNYLEGIGIDRKDYEQEVMDMCNLGKAVETNGEVKGLASAVLAYMQKMDASIEDALHILVPDAAMATLCRGYIEENLLPKN